MIALLLALQLAAPPRRIPGLPADLSFYNVPGALGYVVTGVNVIHPMEVCPSGTYDAATFCQHEQGKRCSIPVPAIDCINTVAVTAMDSDGTIRTGTGRQEANVSARNGGTGAPCYYPHDSGCVYP